MTTFEKTNKILNNLPDFMSTEDNSNNYKFIHSFGTTFDTLSANIDELKLSIQISTASGTKLDDLGKLFLLTRNGGENDSDFRVRILSFWEGYIQGGIKQSLIDTLKSLTGATSVTYDETDDLIIKMSSTIPNLSINLGTISSVLNDIKPAGTFIYLTLSSKLEDIYGLYEDSIFLTTIEESWVLPDYYAIDSAVELL